ncbi:MAG: hypothetical protein Edafosvirus32_8 [Edafosvirus sp.]|uniref:Thioredoxin n=1 Tax=Edafosvirus sp. TaxID=2487765 RepID=A0A3G4ZV45_9VIRU|nr:MAG: hypothetical protein Edafosvirus32_8 [Edafosvirus sp.]
MNRSNILFYSRKCNTCTNLMQILTNENLLGFFKLFCVDDHLNNLPPHIKRVPTMIVNDIDKPLEVAETFKWIERVKFIRQKNTQNTQNTIIKNIENKKIMNTTNSGPLAFYKQEMQGVSDTFGYTTVDIDQPHNYYKYDVSDKDIIFTAKEKTAMSEREQIEKLNKVLNERDIEEGDNAMKFKKEQLDAVIHTEQEKLMNNQ